MPRTKIVCTIGPASASPAILAELARAGMDVTRLNFSHGRPSGHLRVITAARRLAATLKRPLAILQDLAGPKVRIGPIQAGRIVLKSGDRFTLTDRKVPGDSHMVSVSYPGLSREVSPGDSLLLSDGALELEVMETDDHDIRCRVVVGGEPASYKGLNLPSRSLKIPCLTKKTGKTWNLAWSTGLISWPCPLSGMQTTSWLPGTSSRKGKKKFQSLPKSKNTKLSRISMTSWRRQTG